MDKRFRVEQLPDNLLNQAKAILKTDGDTKALSAAQENLAQLAIYRYKVVPMREQQTGERIEQLAKVMTLRRGEKGPETPLGKRIIAIVLEEVENGSVAIQVREAGQKPNEGDRFRLTRHRCQRNTVFILDEEVVIGIPKDGVPGETDKYPDSVKVLLVKMGYVQK